MGVDQGERIHPDHVVDLMRRINAIEDATFERQTRKDAIRIAVDDDNNIHVDVLGTGKINKYTLAGVFIMTYAVTGLLKGWGGSGHIYTLGVGGIARRYTKDGVFIDSFSWLVDGQSLTPSIALDGFVYGATRDGTVVTIYQYNATGSEQDSTTVAVDGSGNEDIFSIPTQANNGDVYGLVIGDPGDHVYKWDNALTPDDDWTVTPDLINEGSGFVAATDGKTVILDSVDGIIYVYSSTGTSISSWAITSAARYQLAIDSSNNLVAVRDDETAQEVVVFSGISSTITTSWDLYEYDTYTPGQTEWFRYPTIALGGKVSLGTPDGGVSVPALDAIEFDIIRPNYTEDMHDAIEAMLVHWKNAVTGNAFDFNNLSSNNLYHVAVESGVYTWQIPGFVGDQGTRITEEWIDEIDSCLTKLEASDPV